MTSSDMLPIDKLRWIMSQLRTPKTGCPWDLEQTYKTIVPYTLEEAYEVADAIENEDFDELKGELGDLLFQVIFYCQLAQEEDRFEFDDVVESINEKLIRRHPHVFGNETALDAEEVLKNWEAGKVKERDKKDADGNAQLLSNIPAAMPALTRAYKIQKRCASVGFDWPDVNGALDKVFEEIEELKEEINHTTRNQALIEEELGDLFFALTNVARYVKAEPEKIMRNANRKFERRFNQVESHFKKQNVNLQDCTLEQMDDVWEQIKKKEKQESNN